MMMTATATTVIFLPLSLLDDDERADATAHYLHMTEFDGRGCSGRNQVK